MPSGGGKQSLLLRRDLNPENGPQNGGQDEPDDHSDDKVEGTCDIKNGKAVHAVSPCRPLWDTDEGMSREKIQAASPFGGRPVRRLPSRSYFANFARTTRTVRIVRIGIWGVK